MDAIDAMDAIDSMDAIVLKSITQY